MANTYGQRKSLLAPNDTQRNALLRQEPRSLARTNKAATSAKTSSLCKASKQAGFTLLELMATAAIVAVLATVAVSYGQGSVRERTFQQATRAVLSAIAAARSEAMRTGKSAYVEFQKNAVVAFIDNDKDLAYSSSDQLLFRYPDNNTPQIYDAFFDASESAKSGSGNRILSFDARGFLVDTVTKRPTDDCNICIKVGRDPASIGSINPRVTWANYVSQAMHVANVRISRYGWSGVTSNVCQINF